MSKLPRITESIAKRVKRANYTWGRHGTCLICKGDWDSCPHNGAQLDLVIEAVQMAEMLGIKLP